MCLLLVKMIISCGCIAAMPPWSIDSDYPMINNVTEYPTLLHADLRIFLDSYARNERPESGGAVACSLSQSENPVQLRLYKHRYQ